MINNVYLGVVGSIRDKFTSIDIAERALFETLDREVEEFLKDRRGVRLIIVSGASPKEGIDILARKYSKVRGYGEPLEFPPDIDKYGLPKAYYVHNEKIVKTSHRVLGFLAPSESPNEKSRSGTMMTIRRGIKKDVTVKVFQLVYDKFEHKWTKWSWLEGWERNIEQQMSRGRGP